ncbi:hypothetical protein BSNT_07989 [Bacillus subtilis subsp. natto BEST195]|nr:hypothetical protein BSNT_07989 [Bacillus subtilis subsp. natto BEST195]
MVFMYLSFLFYYNLSNETKNLYTIRKECVKKDRLL